MNVCLWQEEVATITHNLSALTGAWSLGKAELGGEERQDLIAELYVSNSAL